MDTGWTRSDHIAVFAGVVSAVSAVFVALSAYAAGNAARAGTRAAEAAEKSHAHTTQVWLKQNAERALRELNSIEIELREADMTRSSDFADLSRTLRSLHNRLSASDILALEALAQKVAQDLDEDWQRLVVKILAATRVTTDELLDPANSSAEALKVTDALLDLRRELGRQGRRISHLRLRILYFDPTDPRNQCRPLPERLR